MKKIVFVCLSILVCFAMEAFGFRGNDVTRKLKTKDGEIEINCIEVTTWQNDILDRNMQENGFKIGDCLCGFDKKVYSCYQDSFETERSLNLMKYDFKEEVLERWRNGQAINILVERNGRFFELILLK